ncbi:MAG: NADH-quinone oxidoreductase subunit NuoF [Anaerolineae bacterium]
MIQQTFLVLRNREIPTIGNIDVYLAHGGYEGLKKAVQHQPDEVIDIVKASGLRGRGGAGFPAGVKWGFVPKNVFPKYIAVNADESEPGTFKDREIMEENPHQMLEGALIAAYAIQAETIYIYIRGEYWHIADLLDEKIEEARRAGFVGKNILGTGWSCEVYTHRGAGAYICGEETALLNSLEGKRGQPRVKPPFPASNGLYNQPTVINNVETLACVPYILANGAEAFRQYGTEKSTGTKIFCLSGHIRNPGNYELPMGGETTLRKLIFELGGGTPSGLPVKGILPAGASAAILPATDEVLDTPLDYESLAPFGTGLGSASVIILDESVDMTWAAAKMVKFFAHESCGQCTPCREGTYWLERLYERLEDGHADLIDVETMNSVASQMKGKCICALGEFAVNPVMATIKHFRADYERAVQEAAAEAGPEAHTEPGMEAAGEPAGTSAD